MNYSVRRSIVGFVLAVVMLVAGMATAPASVYMYYAGHGTVPTNQNWTRTDGGPFVPASSETIVGGDLVVVDNNSTFAPFTYRQNATLNTETPWQMRAHVGLLTDYASSTVPLYSQFVNDAGPNNDGGYSFGLVYTNSQTWVSLRGSNDNTPIGIAGNPMLDIVVTKTTGGNPFARGDDPIVLQVYTNNTLVGTVSTTLGSGSSFNPDPSWVEFGNVFGSPTGTFVLSWASFGINEDAPIPTPEPSLVGLGLIGLLIVRRKLRRH